MISKMDVVAFIFARGGSKGLVKKNTRLLMGKPLIAWSIEQAKSLSSIKRVIVSTDSEEIAIISKEYGAEVPFMRPSELAQDDSPEWLSWRHALNYLKDIEDKLPDVMLSVPATSPLRKTEDLNNSLEMFYNGGADAVITITEAHRNPWFNMVELSANKTVELVNKDENILFRRQDARKVYDITTVAYVLSPQFVLTKNSLFSGRVKAVMVPVDRSIDIDTLYDFEIAEYLMSRRALEL